MANPSGGSLHLFVADASKGGNFDLDSVGLLPRVQDGPLGVRDVMPGNPADRAGMRAGDAIVSVNGQAVHSVAAVMALLQETQGKPANLVLQRGSQT